MRNAVALLLLVISAAITWLMNDHGSSGSFIFLFSLYSFSLTVAINNFIIKSKIFAGISNLIIALMYIVIGVEALSQLVHEPFVLLDCYNLLSFFGFPGATLAVYLAFTIQQADAGNTRYVYLIYVLLHIINFVLNPIFWLSGSAQAIAPLLAIGWVLLRIIKSYWRKTAANPKLTTPEGT